MLKRYDRSHQVHENKQNSDKMPITKSDIYVLDSDIYGNTTWILQKNAESDGQFGLIDTLSPHYS